MDPTHGFPCRALLAAPKGGLLYADSTTSGAARLVRPKGCFAAYDNRSIDELSGCTTGRLRYTGPTTAHAIGGTAELALRYSTIAASTAGPSHYQ
jgi:hypothetical protein